MCISVEMSGHQRNHERLDSAPLMLDLDGSKGRFGIRPRHGLLSESPTSQDLESWPWPSDVLCKKAGCLDEKLRATDRVEFRQRLMFLFC